jgi:hypothetical protein
MVAEVVGCGNKIFSSSRRMKTEPQEDVQGWWPTDVNFLVYYRYNMELEVV